MVNLFDTEEMCDKHFGEGKFAQPIKNVQTKKENEAEHVDEENEAEHVDENENENENAGNVNEESEEN